MKKFISLIILVSGIIASAELPKHTTASYKQPNAFFYQIEKSGAVSYLLGSMHIGIPLQTYPTEILLRAEAAKVFIVEGDPFEITPAQSALQKKMVQYPKGNSLDKNISAEAYLKLAKIFGQQKIEKISSYTPAVISVLLGQKLMETLNPDGSDSVYDIESGIDLTLLRAAQEKQKQILFLDDRTQIILDTNESMTAEDLERLLQFKNPIAFQLQCIDLAQRSYLAGDDTGIQKYMAKCIGKGLTATLIKRTNQWAVKLQSVLIKGDAFIVVGVSHVLGHAGLVAKLRSQGYRVQRISSSSADSTLQR